MRISLFERELTPSTDEQSSLNWLLCVQIKIFCDLGVLWPVRHQEAGVPLRRRPWRDHARHGFQTQQRGAPGGYNNVLGFQAHPKRGSTRARGSIGFLAQQRGAPGGSNVAGFQARNGAPLGQEAQLGFRRRQQRARLSQIGFLAQANPCQEELQVSSFQPRKGLLKVGIICWV